MILIENLFLQLLHGFPTLHFVHWFQNSFCWPPTQKLSPNQILMWRPHFNYDVKLEDVDQKYGHRAKTKTVLKYVNKTEQLKTMQKLKFKNQNHIKNNPDVHLHLLPRYFERYFERYFQCAFTSEAQVSSATHSSALHPPSNSHILHYGYSVYTDHDGVWWINDIWIYFYPPSNSHNLHYGYSVTDGYFLKPRSHKLV